MRKTKRGEGVFGNLRFYLRKTKGGGRESGDVSPKGKQKELEVFPYGPLEKKRREDCEQGLKSLNPRPSLILVDCGK